MSVTLPVVWVTMPLAQVVLCAGVVARTMPAPGDVGKVSATLVTVIAAAFGLVIVMVSVDTPPDTIGLGPNALLMVGGEADTVRLTDAEFAPVGASLLATPVAKFGCVPGVLLRTTMETVHAPLAGMVRPLTVSNPV